MDLFFKGTDITARGRGLTFDDVLLVPRHSKIASRKNTNLRARVSRNPHYPHPHPLGQHGHGDG